MSVRWRTEDVIRERRQKAEVYCRTEFSLRLHVTQLLQLRVDDLHPWGEQWFAPLLCVSGTASQVMVMTVMIGSGLGHDSIHSYGYATLTLKWFGHYCLSESHTSLCTCVCVRTCSCIHNIFEPDHTLPPIGLPPSSLKHTVTVFLWMTSVCIGNSLIAGLCLQPGGQRNAKWVWRKRLPSH